MALEKIIIDGPAHPHFADLLDHMESRMGENNFRGQVRQEIMKLFAQGFQFKVIKFHDNSVIQDVIMVHATPTMTPAT